MKVEIWDKVSSINGIPANEFLEDNLSLKKCDIIFIVINRSNAIEKIKDINDVKKLLNIEEDEDVDIEKIRKLYEQHLNASKMVLLESIQSATKTLVKIQNYLK